MIINDNGIDIKLIPILFRNILVEAIMRGDKTNTRRPMVPQPDDDGVHDHTSLPMSLDSELTGFWGHTEEGEFKQMNPKYCRTDILWCRETFYAYGYWTFKDGLTKGGKEKMQFNHMRDEHGNLRYLFEEPKVLLMKGKSGDVGWYKRPSLFMPLEICRCFVTVKGYKPERLMDISNADAIKEGIQYYDSVGDVWKNYLLPQGAYGSPVNSFASLWDMINGKGNFYTNPWVWAYEFERLTEKDVKYLKFLVKNQGHNQLTEPFL